MNCIYFSGFMFQGDEPLSCKRYEGITCLQRWHEGVQLPQIIHTLFRSGALHLIKAHSSHQHSSTQWQPFPSRNALALGR